MPQGWPKPAVPSAPGAPAFWHPSGPDQGQHTPEQTLVSKRKQPGPSGGLSLVSVGLWSSGQVLIAGWCDGAPQPGSVLSGRLLGILCPVLLLVLALSRIHPS